MGHPARSHQKRLEGFPRHIGGDALQSDDRFFDAKIALNCLAMNLSIYEIPINFHSLDKRKFFVRFTAIFEFVRHLLNYRFSPRYRRHSPTCWIRLCHRRQFDPWLMCDSQVAALFPDPRLPPPSQSPSPGRREAGGSSGQIENCRDHAPSIQAARVIVNLGTVFTF